jgi:ABC-type transport system involved in multi-copper enzyme maturation permease subunit
MSSPSIFLILRWLVYVTFRQALASRVFWGMSAVTVICVLLCLSVRVSAPRPLPIAQGEGGYMLPPAEIARIKDPAGVDPAYSELSILFGAIRLSYSRLAEDVVRFFQLLLAGLVADTAGVLLALLWTAGFLPAFLEPRSATVLLAKPVPRWALLVGKCLGVIGFVALQALVFVLGTWVALGVSTGIWPPGYLMCLPIMLFHFAIFFSFSAALAVFTRNSVVSMAGSLAFWVLCWVVNNGRHSAVAAGAPPLSLELTYWALPKPADLNYLLFSTLGADKYFSQLLNYRVLEERGALSLELSLVTSLAFALALMLLAVFRFRRIDY